MTANLEGIIFDQVYGDNSGGAEFDTDGDGTATQEDEFVSFTNTTGAPVDVSGWQIWSDSDGSGAPDTPQDGLYHTFPPGTVLQPGETLYIINEITGTPRSWAQEASSGGVESGAGGASTNFLSEGHRVSTSESVALVDPDSGDYIVFNLGSGSSNIPSQAGFPGTTNIGEIDGNAIHNDMNAGSSFQYNADSGTYEYNDVFVPCFAAGTSIRTPRGDVAVETLKIGDLVCTLDHGDQPIRRILSRRLNFTRGAPDQNRPIHFVTGALGPGRPSRPLAVSPQHRMLFTLPDNRQVLAPAKGLLHRRGVRVMRGLATVHYVHLVFARHEIVFSNDTPSESFYLGQHSTRVAPISLRHAHAHSPLSSVPARPLLKVRQARACL